MATNYRKYIRRLRRTASTTPFQIVSIGVFLLLGIRWVTRHNHEDDPEYAPIGRPVRSVENKRINWSKLYYVQLVDSPESLCNALMIWHQIEEIGSRAQRMLLYPSSWDLNEIDESSPYEELTPIARLLQQANSSYYVKLQPVDALPDSNTKKAIWRDSYTKLIAFNLTQFDRVLALDPGSIVLGNLDDLFLLQAAPVAMPYVYWGESSGSSFSSQMLLVSPSTSSFSKVETAARNAKPDESDTDILTSLFKNQILRIPQRPYSLLSGEFRRKDHAPYLKSHPRPFARNHKWDPDTMLSEAKFLHFSDSPIPKPWVKAKQEDLNRYMPKCSQSEWFGASDCRDRTIWLKLYLDFAVRRQAVCGKGYEMQSQDAPPDSVQRNGRAFRPDEVDEGTSERHAL